MINGAYPAVSPGGKQVVFLSNRTGVDDLFVIRADGTGEMQVTHTPEHESATGWTRNGRQIVFSELLLNAARASHCPGISFRQILLLFLNQALD